MLDYIPDGYTEGGYISPADGFHGPLRFEFRPMLVDERALLYGEAIKRLPEDAQLKKRAQAVASRIKSWSLLDAAGQAVPVNVDRLLRLKPELFYKLLNVVIGLEASDVDPEAALDRHLAVLDERLQALVSSQPAGDLREAADVKN